MTLDEIRAAMKAKGIGIRELAERAGMSDNHLSKSLGKAGRRITVEEMDAIRAALEPETDLMPRLRSIPIIGQVAAGRWRDAVQHPIASLPQPDPSIPARAFALRVSGDSMDIYVEDGGTVIVDPDDKALFPGRFFVILNGDGEATFKQFKADPARLAPCSHNPDHMEIMIGTGEHFEIVGRVIWRANRM